MPTPTLPTKRRVVAVAGSASAKSSVRDVFLPAAAAAAFDLQASEVGGVVVAEEPPLWGAGAGGAFPLGD
ncbi:MAG TPA: hypothetical protein VM142_08555 [Acidimicrobiales bacterium]|nr:hypothetical protein [Acidimicrobiales bacterium]